MNKNLIIVLIVVISILIPLVIGGLFVGGIFASISKATNAEEYQIGNDTIKTVKAVVGKRKITSINTNINNGLTTKKIEYQSSTTKEDLTKYVQYLRNDGDFILTKNMDLSVSPSTVQLSKESNDYGEILMMTIDYDSFGYIITIQKGKGTLTKY